MLVSYLTKNARSHDCESERYHKATHTPNPNTIKTHLSFKLILLLIMVYRSEYANPPVPKKKRTPKTQRREMTNVEKGMIIAFFYCLQNIALVAQVIGRPWTTIKSFLAREYEHQSLENLPRSSRTPVLSHQRCRTIVRAAKNNRKMTRSAFRNQYTPGISLSTGTTLSDRL